MNLLTYTPRPDLQGITAFQDGIEFDERGVAQIVDHEDFIAAHGLPATNERAEEIVARDAKGAFAEAWDEAREEAREDARSERGYEAYVDWCHDNGREAVL